METVAPSGSVLTDDLNNWWERWYQENTINLLLYIGAFLIVMSASIFVGLSWQSLSGSLKSLFLDFLTLAFMGSGLYFYFVTPKLRNAGATFVAIAALLIPFNGLAWYNFVLRDLDFSFGSVWLFTSLISLVTYAFLARSIRSKFYTYIAGIGSLSFIESLVSVGNLPNDYYILGGIFSAFVFIGTAKLFEGGKEEKEVFYEPLYFSSQVVMPASLLFGLLVAAVRIDFLPQPPL